MMRLVLYIVIMGGMLTTADAQDLKRHKWKQRILVVYTDSESNEKFSKQVEELQSNLQGLHDRKLLVYQVIKDQVKTGLDSEGERTPIAVFSNEYAPHKEAFEIQLIGLDGGLKLRQHEVLSLVKLFETIDQMPMRRREMREN